MQLRILGAHHFESRETRFSSHLIDGVLALDAGSLTRALTFDQQRQIRALILTHRHFDHIRDLVPLGLVFYKAEATLDIYAIEDTIDFVVSNVLDPRNCPDFTRMPSPDRPTFRLHKVESYKEFRVLDYTAVAIPVAHSVPTAGFEVSSGSVRLFYTGDTGVRISRVWKHVSPDVLLTEVTYGDEHEAYALEVGHLTPTLLGRSLDEFQARWGYLPIVIATHIDLEWEASIRSGLKDLSRRLGIEIIVSEADLTLKL